MTWKNETGWRRGAVLHVTIEGRIIAGKRKRECIVSACSFAESDWKIIFRRTIAVIRNEIECTISATVSDLIAFNVDDESVQRTADGTTRRIALDDFQTIGKHWCTLLTVWIEHALQSSHSWSLSDRQNQLDQPRWLRIDTNGKTDRSILFGNPTKHRWSDLMLASPVDVDGANITLGGLS